MYSTVLLTKKEDCTSLLEIAKEEKANLEFRKVSLQHRRDVSSGTSITLENDLANVIAQIAQAQSNINSLPDGDTKDKEIVKFKGLDYKLSVLMAKKKRGGIVAVLETEYDIARAEKDITETEDFIAALTERIGTL
jgi:hypothetical protein